MFAKTLRTLCALLCVAGCAQPYPKVEADFESNWQAQSYHAEVALLASAPEAFAKRVQLVRQAKSSIDMTYFDWEQDTLGILLLSEIKFAANRGVKVRLTLDDLMVFNEKWLAELDSHENIEIRIFNPFDSRKTGWLGRAINFSSNQERLDNRLHEKYFNVDHTHMILGGRNIGSDYFGYNKDANFFDLDVLFKGEVIQAFNANYQKLWTSEHVTPIRDLIKVSDDHRYINFYTTMAKVNKENKAVIENVYNHVESLVQPDFVPAEVTPVFDSLQKLVNNKPYFRKRAERSINAALSSAKKIVISTPYIVPTQGKFNIIDQLRTQGTHVTLLTNSSASNDSGFIPAYYQQHRIELLEKGVELYEYKDTARNEDHFYHGDTYYHNKALIFDYKLSFIGSSNFDPRSDFLNIEFGVFIQSEAFAQHLEAYLLGDESLFWHVTLDEQDKPIWSSPEKSTTDNPNYGSWDELKDWIFRKMDWEFEL
ncbi:MULTISPECIES: phospholipase D-like domain-containing protein [Vibrio harveyi group]|uniref:phospholipase D-like domain-containing protein n=1 Tax=Vibrio harveyi group TaxID=717610 RepID=UPI00215BDB20|nr:phospholipase D family protein [Vibrio parahaemolyticus]MCR9663939.1 phospholipase D family protein [Vibrio parahaemolyticus]MCR9676533.1 phospholipase D family protein [Vibrio parahaemolyticus]